MKKLALLTTLTAVAALGTITPSYADGAVHDVCSLVGSTTAIIVGVPEGIVVDSLWRMPLKTWHTLADKFGDDKGFQQNVAGAFIGIPVGFVWGIPEGAIRGGLHGMNEGWEKPFSTDSFLCIQDDK